MEVLGILVVLALIGWVFFLPLWLWHRSSELQRKLGGMENQLDQLLLEFHRLRRETRENPPTPSNSPAPQQEPVANLSTEAKLAASPDLARVDTAGSPPSNWSAGSQKHDTVVGTTPPQPPAVSATPVPSTPVSEPTLAKPPTEPAPPPPSSSTPTSGPAHRPPPLPPLTRPAIQPPTPFNWERFVGVKLVAWLGGLVLFLAAAYFVKYSFEQDLIPPEVRVSFGFLLGIGLIVGGSALKRKAYEVTSQTLCASGTLILYAVTFACRGVYHFPLFSPTLTFALMTLITASAFFLAVRLNAVVVAVLGMVGGFLTPVILSTGQDQPVGLFVYITLLDIGLLAVALARPWSFLVGLAAFGTVVMELGWTARFLTLEKLNVALITQTGFNLLFLAANELAARRDRRGNAWSWTPAVMAVISLVYAMWFNLDHTIGTQLLTLGTIALIADLCLMRLSYREPSHWQLHWVGAAMVNGFLAFWMVNHLTPGELPKALGVVLLFAVLHTLFPILLSRRYPGTPGLALTQIVPTLGLGMLLIPLFNLPSPSLLLWPVAFLIDLIAIGIAVVSRSVVGVITGLVLTSVLGAAWIFQVPVAAFELGPILVVVGIIAALFLAGSLFLLRRLSTVSHPDGEGAPSASGSTSALEHLPALSAGMPFLLLILISAQIPLPQPSAVFALASTLVIMMLAIVRRHHQPILALVALIGSLALEFAWHQRNSNWESNPSQALGWHLWFGLLSFGFPLIFARHLKESSLPWAAGALALPLHFPLLYRVIHHAWPNPWMGLLPAALAIPALLSVVRTSKVFEPAHPRRLTALAWTGGSALFFVTAIFPTQWDRQWITVAWALEGVALCWLFHRLPHPGLRWAGVGLLVVSFIRLALNPAVLSYHVRGTTPILNWYLYAFGVVTITLFAGAKLLAPPRDQDGPVRFPPILNALGTILLFILVNLEIADNYTSPGTATLVFEFEGNLPRDMSYTIAWSVFAFGLIAIGIRKRIQAARWAGLGLIGVVLLKLFFHDLSQLSQLYRIGALAAVAVIAILSSVLYQKFASNQDKSESSEPPSAT